jgi:hypothetical protein
MCCLKYEQDAYEDLIRRSPKEESFVDTPEGRGTVVALNLLRQQVKVQMEDSPETISAFRVDEIAVLRNGKAKKTDPPIPADLAPISGGGKRQRKPALEKVENLLDPIKFRYRDEQVVAEEQPQPEPAEEPVQEYSRSRRRRNRHNKAEVIIQDVAAAQQENAPKKQEKPTQKQEAQEAAPEVGEEKAKSGHRRNHHHHRRRHHKSGGNQAAE